MTVPAVTLAVDAGNSRIKWGLHVGGAWQSLDAIATADAAALTGAWTALAPRPDGIVVSNVAGAAARLAIEDAARALGLTPAWFVSSAVCAGVTSRYDDPTQLGSDRWAALLGARARSTDACVVVNAGTAITVDCLTAAGVFVGGLIAPGIDLMLDALAKGTAGLPARRGEFRPYPRNTADAMTSGALAAAAGAVNLTVRRFAQDQGAEPRVLLSGGAGPVLMPFLEGRVERVAHLVLEGLVASQAVA